ncbi:MAG TPA: M23 family metallopeptidase [Myxococcota bacterium]
MRPALLVLLAFVVAPAPAARADAPSEPGAGTPMVRTAMMPTDRPDLWNAYTAAKKENVARSDREIAAAAGLPSAEALEQWEREAQESVRERAREPATARNGGGLVGMITDAPKARITSDYGVRVDPMSDGLGTHSGVDIGAPYGSNIFAAAAGVVTVATFDTGYGFMVEIQHKNGMRTRYCHASGLLVEKGRTVEAGQKIAIVGSTGRSTGAHVHFEVRNARGVPVDPHSVIRNHALE